MKRPRVNPRHPLLNDPEAFERAIIRTVASSTAVETGENVDALEREMRRRRGGSGPGRVSRKR